MSLITAILSLVLHHPNPAKLMADPEAIAFRHFLVRCESMVSMCHSTYQTSSRAAMRHTRPAVRFCLDKAKAVEVKVPGMCDKLCEALEAYHKTLCDS